MSKTTEQYSSQPAAQLPIWENKTTKIQIRILNIANKIVVGEMIPNKAPIFLTSIDLEENYRMVKAQTNSH